jgi:hypothetical protein
MRRIRELLGAVELAHPSDHFFANIEQTWGISPQARAQYAAYDRALRVLDNQSWHELKAKAVKHFRDHRNGQLKQGFFNQLNEAFAYEFLLRRGFGKVRILREGGATMPDIAYCEGTHARFCEVKTIGISEEQISRRSARSAYSGAIYSQLSPGFLKKLNSTISHAWSQIASQGDSGLVYLLVLFDDFTLMYYDTYRRQILRCIAKHPAEAVYIKVGLLGRRRIAKPGSTMHRNAA